MVGLPGDRVPLHLPNARIYTFQLLDLCGVYSRYFSNKVIALLTRIDSCMDQDTSKSSVQVSYDWSNAICEPFPASFVSMPYREPGVGNDSARDVIDHNH
jgi:hypothetical protein